MRNKEVWFFIIKTNQLNSKKLVSTLIEWLQFGTLVLDNLENTLVSSINTLLIYIFTSNSSLVFTSHDTIAYIVGSRGASQLGGIF